MKPLILAVEDVPETADRLRRDLGSRYGTDYQVIVLTTAVAALQRLTQAHARGQTVALLVASLRLEGRAGVDLMTRVPALHPLARRMLLVEFGDAAGFPAVIRAMTLGEVDSYVLKPWETPDEWLHPAVGEMLSEWAKLALPRFHLLHLVGREPSAETYSLRTLLDQNLVPYGFIAADSKEGGRMLREHGLDDSRLPVVVLHDGTVLAQPTADEFGAALGIQTRPGEETYDVAIVGAGVAGLAAAVAAASQGLHTVVLEGGALGGQAARSPLVRNYVGFPRGIRGNELTLRAWQQGVLLGAETIFASEVEGLSAEGDQLTLACANGSLVRAGSVVIATGMTYRRLDVPGAEALIGAGVFYTDGASEASSLRGQDVYIVGGGNSAAGAAVSLAQQARQVTILVREASLGTNVSAYLMGEIGRTAAIRVRGNTEIVGVTGAGRLEAIDLRDTVTGSVETVPAAALFVMIGSTPHTDWLDGTLPRDDAGYILTGPAVAPRAEEAGSWTLKRPPLPLETGLPRVFAVGDVRSGSPRGVASAAGEAVVCVGQIRQALRPQGI